MQSIAVGGTKVLQSGRHSLGFQDAKETVMTREAPRPAFGGAPGLIC
jgi:hypothetical protein